MLYRLSNPDINTKGGSLNFLDVTNPLTVTRARVQEIPSVFQKNWTIVLSCEVSNIQCFLRNADHPKNHMKKHPKNHMKKHSKHVNSALKNYPFYPYAKHWVKN